MNEFYEWYSEDMAFMALWMISVAPGLFRKPEEFFRIWAEGAERDHLDGEEYDV